MDIAKELGTWLGANGFGTLGSSIFIGQIPADVDGIYIVRSGGGLNNYIPVQATIVDIYAKNQSAENAITTLEAIKRFAHRMHNFNTTNGYFYSVLVLGDIEDVQRMDNYAKIVKITVQVTSRDKTLIS